MIFAAADAIIADWVVLMFNLYTFILILIATWDTAETIIAVAIAMKVLIVVWRMSCSSASASSN